jgi:hypothetical protein
VVVIARGDTTVIESDAVAVAPVGVAESFTITVKVDVPFARGVPLITPFAAFSERPAGNEPTLIDQVYGAKPPVSATAAEYATPFWAVGSDVVLIDIADTTIESAFVPVPAVGVVESVTLTVKLNVPVVVGVPVIAPVEAFSERPLGNEPVVIDHAYGVTPPEAATDCE